MRASSFLAVLLPCASLLCTAAQAAVYDIRPLTLPGDYRVAGTVTTDGTAGPIGPSNILGWNIAVTQATTLFRATRATTQPMIGGVSVSPDGQRMSVVTSPDGVEDGGLLAFGRIGGSPVPRLSAAFVADFTANAAAGGQAGYIAGDTGAFLPLGAANGTEHLAAQTAAPGSSRFEVAPMLIDGSPEDGIVLSGHITTDGTTGPLAAAAILGWDILVQQVLADVFTEANSSLFGADGLRVSADGSLMAVDNPDGLFGFAKGALGGRLHGVVLADFTNGQNQAGYFLGRLLVTVKEPLSGAPSYIVAATPGTPIPTPAPGGLGLMVTGLAGLLAAGRRRGEA